MKPREKKTTGQIINDMVEHEFKWYRRLWHFFFRPKNELSVKDIRKAVRQLRKLNE